MKVPAIIYIVLVTMSVSFSISDHGKPRKDENAWSAIISAIIAIGLLIWGGFFS